MKRSVVALVYNCSGKGNTIDIHSHGLEANDVGANKFGGA